MTMLVCDTHTHLWAADSPDRPWPPGGPEYFRGTSHRPEPLDREELLRRMDEAGVDRAVILPPPWEGYRNDMALEAADMHPDRFAVMGRLPLDEPHKAKALVQSWENEPGIKGVRLGFRGDKEREWLSNGTADWYWAYAEEHDIPTWVYMPNSRPQAAAIAAKHPGLRLVMDNFNVPGGTVDDAIGPIADEAVALAGYPNVSIKLSGMSGCSTEPYPFANINPYLQKLIEAFEPRRCFWGTDFTRLPILDRCTYGETVTHFTEQMDFLGEEDKEWIMGRAVSEFLDWPID